MFQVKNDELGEREEIHALVKDMDKLYDQNKETTRVISNSHLKEWTKSKIAGVKLFHYSQQS